MGSRRRLGVGCVVLSLLFVATGREASAEAAPSSAAALYAQALALDQPGADTATVARVVGLYRQASALGSAAATAELGIRTMYGDGVVEDEPRALALLREAAAAGMGAALRELGKAYANGWGVEEDDEVAADWFRRAARQGDGEAAVALGEAALDGVGMPADTRAADGWFVTARELFERELAAPPSPSRAQTLVQLALLYDEGHGVREDNVKALGLYLQAAEMGSVEGQSSVALMHLYGEGTRQDTAQAVRWLRRAAARDDSDAMDTLAEIYMSDEYGSEDHAAYLYWSSRKELLEQAGDDPDLPAAEERRLEAELRKQVASLEAAYVSRYGRLD